MKKLVVLLPLVFWFSQTVLGQEKKVAVVTFYADKYIDFSQLDGGVNIGATIATLVEDERFDLQPIVNKFHDTYFNDFAPQFPFALIPEEEVINNEEYLAYESKHGESEDEDRNLLFQRYITYEGYKPLGRTLLKKNSNEVAMLDIFDEVDGVMFVFITYYFVKKPVPFTAGVQANVFVQLYNREGKKVIKFRKFAVSDNTVGIVGGIPAMDPDKLLPLCEQATFEVVGKMEKKLGKMAKKAAKKL